MSDDSDIAIVGRAIDEARKSRHAVWKAENTRLLVDSGIPFTAANDGEALLLRHPGKIADFYPSTGRWRSGNKTFRGGATAFLAWYAK